MLSLPLPKLAEDWALSRRDPGRSGAPSPTRRPGTELTPAPPRRARGTDGPADLLEPDRGLPHLLRGDAGATRAPPSARHQVNAQERALSKAKGPRLSEAQARGSPPLQGRAPITSAAAGLQPHAPGAGTRTHWRTLASSPKQVHSQPSHPARRRGRGAGPRRRVTTTHARSPANAGTHAPEPRPSTRGPSGHCATQPAPTRTLSRCPQPRHTQAASAAQAAPGAQASPRPGSLRCPRTRSSRPTRAMPVERSRGRGGLLTRAPQGPREAAQTRMAHD